MKESAFIKRNKEKWKGYEQLFQHPESIGTEKLSEMYIVISDDLSFSRTYYGNSRQVTQYLNNLAGKLHFSLYKNKKEKKGRIVDFWLKEVPLTVAENHRFLLFSLLIFAMSAAIGALSAAHDDSFVRIIMGDGYVNMTLENIEKGDPMAVYKQSGETSMFFGITINNIKVSFLAFASGVFTSIATGFLLLQNGIMLGSFQYFFYEKGLFLDSFLTIWIHGTLEISAIIVAGGAGLLLGSGWLFPGTYSRTKAFQLAAKKGLKIVVGCTPIFILAGFLESFVTRHTEMPDILKVLIILGSLSFILFYFVFYPLKLKSNG